MVGRRDYQGEATLSSRSSNLAFRRRAAESAKMAEETKQSTREHSVTVVKEEQLKHVGYDELNDDDMARIELRFLKRRDLLTKSCHQQGLDKLQVILYSL